MDKMATIKYEQKEVTSFMIDVGMSCISRICSAASMSLLEREVVWYE